MQQQQTTTTTTTNAIMTTASSNSGPSLVKNKFNWIFEADKFSSTPSTRDKIPFEEEMSLRQRSAVFIFELGTNLRVPHYCINTAAVYMHRFYMIHSFQRFTRQLVCAASLFLACKVEECPRTLRDVIENTGKVLPRRRAEELTKEMIEQYTDDIVLHENILLSTLGFSLMVDHPHPIIIKTIQTLGTPRELAHSAYYLATTSILLTSFCVKYPPDLIACFCIHLAAAWLKIEIPSPAPVTNADGSTNGSKHWFHLVNESFTEKQLGELADEFLQIYEKCPDKIKKKLVYQNERQPQTTSHDGASSSVSSSADSVVPQGAIRVKTESRQPQPPHPSSSAHPVKVQPSLPPHSSSSGAIKREPSAAPSYSTSVRPPVPPNSASSRAPSFQHPPLPPQQPSLPPPPPPSSSSHYHHPPPSHHPQQQQQQHLNYNQNSRYPTQHARPGPPHPSGRPSQQPPLPPPQNGSSIDRKPPPPPLPYDHPPPLPPSSSNPSQHRPSSQQHYGSQQRGGHYNNARPPPPPAGYPQPPQAPYGHNHHSHPPSLMRVGTGGEKRPYDQSSYDSSNKRPRPSTGLPPSSSQQQPAQPQQQWNNK